MPQNVKDAVIAAENRSFWTDKGLDPKGILRAAFSNASGNSQQGASTITQQYVKILYLTQERTYKRKVKEAIVSLKLQRQQTKEQILEGYLNTIYFGRGAYGIEAAAQAFFGKKAKDLNLRESAVLASVINNPTRFDPANGEGQPPGAARALPVRPRRHGRDGHAPRRRRSTRHRSGCRSSPRSRPSRRTPARRASCSTWSRRSCCASTSPRRRSTAVACGSTRRSASGR